MAQKGKKAKFKKRRRRITKPALKTPWRRAGYLGSLLNVTETTFWRWSKKYKFPRRTIGKRGKGPAFVWFRYADVRPILKAEGFEDLPLTDKIK